MTLTILTWHGHHSGFERGPWWGLVWLLFWAVVAVVTISWLRRRRPVDGGARDVLADRYARGDIDDVEYRHRLGVLSEKRR